MKISVEITFAPLQEEYKDKIKNFIIAIRKSGFKYSENPLSTHIYGEYTSLMYFLTRSIQESFEEIDAGIISLKIFKSDRSKYIPFD
ncbi:thiamine-binding protein [Bacteroidota bacterium]|nr:thiamine-binding protein [Bacteroidota bacterium]